MSIGKQQIAEAFERHLGQFGYDKTNLDDLAREMHISKKTIYVHFDSKREIYAYLVEQMAAREKMRLTAAVAPLPTFSAKVEAVMTFVMDSARAHINETGRDEWVREYEIAADAFRKANGDLIRELVQGGMDTGEFAKGDVVLVERMVAVMILDYVQMVNDDPSYNRDVELRERILKFIR